MPYPEILIKPMREDLTRFGVDYIIKQTAETAGIAGTISGNTLRRRFVVAAHERGEDLDTIRDSVGHTNARTTRRYIPPTASGDTRT